MSFEIQALQELKPNGKYKASELEDGTFVLEWDVDKNGGEAAPTMDEINTKAAQIQSEIPIRHLRKVRDELLSATDWTQNPDVPESTRTKWVSYRQALRDLPSNSNPKLDDNNDLDMSSVVWPTKPS